jgi:hypothetical protein
MYVIDWPVVISILDPAVTLIVGIAAVIGAVKVGFRQAKISDYQNKILAQQVQLERAKIANDLFDRRWFVYITTIDWTVAFLNETKGIEPYKNDAAFEKARMQSRFLFDPAVFDRLNTIYNHAMRYYDLNRKMEGFFSTHRAYRAGDGEKVDDAANATFVAIGDLNELFHEIGIVNHIPQPLPRSEKPDATHQ